MKKATCKECGHVWGKKMKCPKCGYEWWPRVDNPKECPNCKQMLRKFVKMAAVLFILFFAFPVQAELTDYKLFNNHGDWKIENNKSTQQYHFAEAWGWKDSVLEGILFAETAVDFGQATYGAEHPNEYKENNPFLPKHPSKNQIIGACIIGAVSHAVISAALKPVYHVEIGSYKTDFHARRWWQGVTITLEGANVIRNKTIGIGWSW